MQRREIFKLAATASTLALVPAISAISKVRKENKKHLIMVIDLSKCNGCKACTISCGVENGNSAYEHRTEVHQSSINVSNKQYVFNFPMLCNQCEEPSCVSVCPTNATYKRQEDGIIAVDSKTCIGCNYCIKACPYEGVRFENTQTDTVDKCNFCVHRTSKGMLPACVETCIGEAREFGDLNDKNSKVSKLLDNSYPMVLQAHIGTKPNVFYIGLPQDKSNQRYSLHNNIQWQR